MTSARLRTAQAQLKKAQAAVKAAKRPPPEKPAPTPAPPLTPTQRQALLDARQSLLSEINAANEHGLAVQRALQRRDVALGTPEKLDAAKARYAAAVAALKTHEETFDSRLRDDSAH